MENPLGRLNPFKTPEARRLTILFAVVYFSQGMWGLPLQTLTLVLKEKLGLSAGQVATFFSISMVPWLIKPVYGLVSDFVPIAGVRRKGYLLLASALACSAAVTAAFGGYRTYWPLALLFGLMGFGLAVNDVMTDALMVERGRPLGLTGAFQSVQWASLYGAATIVGLVGGRMAESRSLTAAFALAAVFPLLTFVMAIGFVHEAPATVDREALRETWRAIREALSNRPLWAVAGFILFFTFSPSIGTALFYYQTDVLRFSQTFIGTLTSLGAGASIIGAAIYAPLSRRFSLLSLVVTAIAIAVAGTLAYLWYRDATRAVVIEIAFGCIGMITQLAFLDLAARACPARAEGTFFALLMSVYNAGVQGSQIVGGYLYDALGYQTLVVISAAATALTFALLPFVDIAAIDRRAHAATSAAADPFARDDVTGPAEGAARRA